jgi:UDP-N-acetylmuramoyl-L-alanyl-D-glutamate--2,6-diaminopimelate ligase
LTGFLRQQLPELVAKLPIRLEAGIELPQTQVTGVVFDSRQVQPGNIFVALSGGNTDGHRFIPSALERGAIAVVGSQTLQGLTVPYFQVEDTRMALAYLSAAFCDFPARQLTVIGVTGTDGKTTTSNLIFQILLAAGIRAGIISTVNAVIGDEVVDTGFHVTTPEAPEIQHYLARMLAAGLTHVVLETTSHGLAQSRVVGCEFDIGVVTNITHEHLDYHGNYAAYREAKGKLFKSLGETCDKTQGNPRLAVLNRDDSSFEYLREITPVRYVDYSIGTGGALWADELTFAPGIIGFSAHGADFQARFSTSMVGVYNVSNCLAAIGATVMGLGISPETAVRGIELMRAVPGRMERISLGQDFTAIVDFAHTPNALKVALETVRQMTAGKVLVVFGSAGLRDRAKRRMMAEVSVQLADLTFLTAEDPRTESLDGILNEMADAAKACGGEEGRNFWRVPDRGEAIRKAVWMAQPGDVVIACGKGHEQSMCFDEVEHPWDDRIAMRAALAELLAVSGPKMPYLPTQG